MIRELGPGLRSDAGADDIDGALVPRGDDRLSETIFSRQANGSLLTANGKVVGSS